MLTMNNTIDLVKKLGENQKIIAQATSNSMTPVIKKGDKVTIRKVRYTDVEVKDIIAFYIADRKNIIVHRVVQKINEKKENYLVTKGDNNRVEDPWIVTEKNFLGKIIKVKNV